MEIRGPFGFLFVLGSLGWPVGLFLLGGPDDPTGGPVILIGSLLVLISIASSLPRYLAERQSAREQRRSRAKADRSR